MLASGFADWTLQDYKQFFKAFRKRSLEDVEGIASEIESKTPDEVASYFHIFCQRFHEVKERDQVLLKLQKKDFETQNLEVKNFPKCLACLLGLILDNRVAYKVHC